LSPETNNSLSLTLNEKPIQLVKDFKYLGVIFDSQANFNTQLQTVQIKLGVAVSKIRTVKKFLTPKAFTTIFNAYIIPIVDFCSEVWLVQPKSKIDILQHKVNKLFFEFFESN